MATCDHHTLTVTTDMATVGGYNYVKESVLAMADHKEDINNIDFGMLVMGKYVADDDEEQRERPIKANRIYDDEEQAKVGASGALVRTGALGAPSVMSEARSTSSVNVRNGYRVKSPQLTKERSKTAVLEEALQKSGIDPEKLQET